MSTSKMILFTGFLGSGKTSLLLRTARYLAGQKKQCAIIVNEVGEIGIDNLQMKKMGYDVWEIFGGCICCTLATSLEETVSNLTTNYEIEYILMEPSGAADPKALFGPLKHGGFGADNLHNIFIMDSTRIEMFKAVLEPYLQSSIPLADLVVINKIDVASTAEIDVSESVVREFNPGVAIIKANLNELEDRQIDLLIR